MTAVTRYSTTPVEGVDINNTYTVSASLTPETPAPPFLVGTEVIGLSGAQYVFVQASTSISANDFVAITGSHTANSLTSVNIVSSLGGRIGVAPGSPVVTSTGIAAGTYFWAQINGTGVSANAIAASTASATQLYTSLTAGILASVTSTSSQIVAGVVMTASATANPQTFAMSWPRISVYSTAGGVMVGAASAPISP